MKKILCFLSILSLYAQEKEPSYWDFHPIHVGGNAIAVGKADIDVRGGSHSGDLTFNKVNAFAYVLLPVSHTSYFFPRVEWNRFTMNWSQNPKFNQTNFEFIQFALTFFSIAVEKWRWISRVEFNFDAAHFSSFREYGLFSALLWGTYELSPDWHYHVGALGYTGMRGAEVYPVIGLDYSWAKKWMVQALFPINYSIEYSMNKEWRFSLKGKPLKERFRAGKNEPQPKSVFSYSSTGLEFNVHYERFLRLEAEAFIGYNFGGSFYIKDRHGKNSLYTDLQGAPYIGANLNWGF